MFEFIYIIFLNKLLHKSNSLCLRVNWLLFDVKNSNDSILREMLPHSPLRDFVIIINFRTYAVWNVYFNSISVWVFNNEKQPFQNHKSNHFNSNHHSIECYPSWRVPSSCRARSLIALFYMIQNIMTHLVYFDQFHNRSVKASSFQILKLKNVCPEA